MGTRGWLTVTIDTEEEGLWTGKYSPQATVENIQAIPRFQAICDRHQIRPTYLITTPVADSAAAVKTLRSIQDSERCEIGTHVHPWNSPPLAIENEDPRKSYMCNLSPEIQHAKLEQLTDLIDQNFGRRPVSFRAGRYGIGLKALESLRQLGYRVDSSVLPRANYREQNGPDFRKATCQPYFPSANQLLKGGGPKSLIEIPVTAGFTHRHFGVANCLRNVAMRRPFCNLRAVGILDRVGIATKVKLSPEQATLAQMKRLATAVIQRQVPLLVMMFHSSSLLAGCSPYVETATDLDNFLQRIEDFFVFAREELGLEVATLGECYERLGNGAARIAY